MKNEKLLSSEIWPSNVHKNPRLWVGDVPPNLCASERNIRKLFEPFGEIESVVIRRDFADLTANGFFFITYLTGAEANAALSAIKDEKIGQYKLQAAKAFPRGPLQPSFEQEQVRSIVLGHASVGMSQISLDETEDPDDLQLQNLSQTSRRKKKNRRKHRLDMNPDE